MKNEVFLCLRPKCKQFQMKCDVLSVGYFSGQYFVTKEIAQKEKHVRSRSGRKMIIQKTELRQNVKNITWNLGTIF
jgi:hypothetical protein